jgi:nitronate monooxygenase
MLGIEYPILCGGMRNISKAALVAAVSDAGGFGILESAQFSSGEGLRAEIRKTRSLTKKPFGVNITLFPWADPKLNDQFIEVVVQEGIRAVETSGFRGPGEFVERLNRGNVRIIHKVSTVRHAVSAEKEGADAVTIAGFEQGGALGREDITTLILVPRTVDEVKIPVLAAGGIGDGRGLAAALALGAEGVVMGTRFLAVEECITHPAFKEWMAKAKETDVVVVGRTAGRKSRVIVNKATQKILELEAKNAPSEQLIPLLEGREPGKVYIEGDVENGIAGAGQAVGLVKSVQSAREVIEEMVRDALAMRQKLDKMIPG